MGVLLAGNAVQHSSVLRVDGGSLQGTFHYDRIVERDGHADRCRFQRTDGTFVEPSEVKAVDEGSSERG